MCLNHSCSDNVSYIVINGTPDFRNVLEGSAYFKLYANSKLFSETCTDFQLESANEIFLKADICIAI